MRIKWKNINNKFQHVTQTISVFSVAFSFSEQTADTYSDVPGDVSYNVSINVLESMYYVEKYITTKTISILIASNITDATIDGDLTNSTMTANITNFTS